VFRLAVERSLDSTFGLDEEATVREAVKFRPGMTRRLVPVEVIIEVSFTLRWRAAERNRCVKKARR
jgi:hypothetical protein